MKEGGPERGCLDEVSCNSPRVWGSIARNRFLPRIVSVFLAESRKSAQDLAERTAPPPFIAAFGGSALDSGHGPLALIEREPAAAVGAHVLDQRDEGAALVGELIGDARGHLGEGAALDDALLLESPEAQ